MRSSRQTQRISQRPSFLFRPFFICRRVCVCVCPVSLFFSSLFGCSIPSQQNTTTTTTTKHLPTQRDATPSRIPQVPFVVGPPSPQTADDRLDCISNSVPPLPFLSFRLLFRNVSIDSENNGKERTKPNQHTSSICQRDEKLARHSGGNKNDLSSYIQTPTHTFIHTTWESLRGLTYYRPHRPYRPCDAKIGPWRLVSVLRHHHQLLRPHHYRRLLLRQATMSAQCCTSMSVWTRNLGGYGLISTRRPMDLPRST